MTLADDLAALPAELRAKLQDAGFDAGRLLALAETLKGDAAKRRDARNRVTGQVTPPLPGEILELPLVGSERDALQKVGDDALHHGKLAFVVMAGGMATRMGGVVKALVEAIPGKTFLDLRLRENAVLSKRVGRPVPLWLMTSDATHGPIEEGLRKASAPPHVRTFRQGLSLRLTSTGALFRGEGGQPSSYATGHGDLVDAVRRSGLLASFREQGGEVVWITNLDNLGAAVDPVLLGMFLEARNRGARVMVEVCDKAQDKGGIPVHAEGKLQVLEEFRLPVGFDPTEVKVFNTNTFLVDAGALATCDIRWSWFEVEKAVGRERAVQFERLLQELTGALPSAYVRVPRGGAGARFLPVKDHAELEKRRDAIEAVLRARGVL